MWKKGQETYQKLIENIGAFVSSSTDEGVLEFNHSPSKVVKYAKDIIPEFINGLRVMDIVAIHEYLMNRAEITPDPRTPTYVYSGGDRVTSVSRYIMKHIDLELAKQYA